jgi:hypothetical protein
LKRFGEGRDAASLGGRVFMVVADRSFEDHRNGFIRFGLYSGMKLFLAFFVLITAQAMSLKGFKTKPAHDRPVYVVDFVEKMTADQGTKNPLPAQDDAASTDKPPMIIQNPDGTFTVQKEPPKEGAKYTKAKKGLVIPPQVVVPIATTAETRN